MTDIVERLRNHFISPHHGGCADCYGLVMDDAADEIERLRAALQKIANPVGYFQEYAKKEGRQIDGHMAIQVSKDPGWLSSEAAKALSRS